MAPGKANAPTFFPCAVPRAFIPLLAPLLFLSVLMVCRQAFALTSQDLIRLKKAGVPENLIVLMLESGYENADEVVSLEKAGFSAETIEAFILANRSKTGSVVYSTKGLEDQTPGPEQNICPPYWQDMLPYTGLFISPKNKGKERGGQSGGTGRANTPGK